MPDLSGVHRGRDPLARTEDLTGYLRRPAGRFYPALMAGNLIDEVRWDLRLRAALRRRARDLHRTPDPSDEPIEPNWTARTAAALVCLSYIVLFSVWTVNEHRGFGTNGFDLGIFDQGVWLLSRFETPFITVRGLHLFGDHTSFILLAVAPLYWVFDTASTLLVVQSVALGLGAVPVFLLARQRSRSEVLACLLAVAYLAQPVIGWTNADQFHPESFVIPLLLGAFYAAERRAWKSYFALLTLSLLVKEDVALVVVVFGIYVAFRYRRSIGFATTTVALLWLIAIQFLVFPYYNGVGSLYADRAVGNFGGFGGLLSAAVTRPWDILELALSEHRPTYLWQLFAPLALAPLLAPGFALAAVVTLFGNLIGTWPYATHIQYHYSVLTITVLVGATVHGVASLRERFRLQAASIVLVAALICGYLWGPNEFSRGSAFHIDPSTKETRAAAEALALIPPEAGVSAQYSLVPHLTHREHIYQFPTPWRVGMWGPDGEALPDPEVVDYIFVSPTGTFDFFGAFPSEDDLLLLDSLSSGDFEKIFDKAGLELYRRLDG